MAYFGWRLKEPPPGSVIDTHQVLFIGRSLIEINTLDSAIFTFRYCQSGTHYGHAHGLAILNADSFTFDQYFLAGYWSKFPFLY